ncbi:MAG: helix-turn-helix domain-containing protein, partial [Anaeroplasmataceae bacterium]|nr:helix-turn-helix domain-containing protein [Anaeroplasmataceae bacterium]
TIVKWEQNRGFPNIETLQQISELFDLSIDELLSEKQLEMIRMLDTKKISLLKRIVIILIAILSLVIVSAIALGIIYHPRDLSSYVKEDISTFDRIEVLNYDGKIFTFDENEQMQLFNKILNISVIPKHLFIKKTSSSFDIMIYFKAKTYRINQFYLDDGATAFYYEPVNYSMYKLVQGFIGESI